MTENWRKKIAMSLVFTFPEPKEGKANSLPFSLMAPVTVIRSRRSCEARTCLFSATRSPDTFSPAAFLPLNVKTGITCSPSPTYRAGLACALPAPPCVCCARFHSLGQAGALASDYCGAGTALPLHRRRRRTARHSSAAVDHLLQFLRHRRALDGRLQRDLFLEVQRRQRLVERLHPELVLARLHGGVDLVDLVLADEVADSRVGHQDLHRHRPAL